MPDIKDLITGLMRGVKSGDVKVIKVEDEGEFGRIVLGMPGNDGEEDDLERRRSPRMTHDQMTVRLTEYFAQVYENPPETLRPGMIVYHKSPSMADIKGTMLSDGSPNPHIVIEMLPQPVQTLNYVKDTREFGVPSSAFQVDMKIGCIGDGTFSVYFSDSRLWTQTKPRGRAPR